MAVPLGSSLEGVRLGVAVRCFCLNCFRKLSQSRFHVLQYLSFRGCLCDSDEPAAFVCKLAVQTKAGKPGNSLFAQG
jgi:hypothetical protein